MMGPTENDYRTALHAAQRALMHALYGDGRVTQLAVVTLVDEALTEVSRVLDIGRDERMGQAQKRWKPAEIKQVLRDADYLVTCPYTDPWAGSRMKARMEELAQIVRQLQAAR